MVFLSLKVWSEGPDYELLNSFMVGPFENQEKALEYVEKHGVDLSGHRQRGLTGGIYTLVQPDGLDPFAELQKVRAYCV